MASSTSQITSTVSAAKPLLASANPPAADTPAHVMASNAPASPPGDVPTWHAYASVDETPALLPPNSPDHEPACPLDRPEDHESASGDGLATHRQVLPHGSLALGQAIVNPTLAEAAGVATDSKDARYFITINSDGSITEQPYKMTPRSAACKAFRADTLGPVTAHDDEQHPAAAPAIRTQLIHGQAMQQASCSLERGERNPLPSQNQSGGQSQARNHSPTQS
ncbi:hypothetical protein WJX72_002106 [[Myrmecia] bisecta]|uniref:Uncharacterized protein n=1 Tax=[Myrmecia] bisecta TaxID=41462 RepID=A0AAW1Q0Z2_9CHLO